jgi:hypothetical protein
MKSEEDRWWDTFNAAVTGIFASVDLDLDEGRVNRSAAKMADEAHGTLSACTVSDAEREQFQQEGR